jgi:hypothetical protein
MEGETMGSRYGPRDAASVLMGKGHRVALRWRSVEGRTQWAIYLDGQPVTLRALENEAERYERLRYRITERGNRG